MKTVPSHALLRAFRVIMMTVVFVACVLAASCDATAQKAALVFVRGNDSRKPSFTRIWAIKTDGTGLREIKPELPYQVGYGDITYSPDGKHIAFLENWMNGKLLVMNRDGQNAKSYVPMDKYAWSPDSRKIAYSHFFNSEATICVLDIMTSATQCSPEGVKNTTIDDLLWSLDGTSIFYSIYTGKYSDTPTPKYIVFDLSTRTLKELSETDPLFSRPIWFENGRMRSIKNKIAWSGDFTKTYFFEKGANENLDVADKDGENAIFIGTSRVPAYMTADGSKIVFLTRLYEEGDLHVVETKGENNLRLTLFQSIIDFSLSPDDKEIIFISRGEPRMELWGVDEDGGSLKKLVEAPVILAPKFSPDNKKIVFTSYKSGNPDIWSINADGTSLTQLTDYPGMDFSPVFSPDGKKIVYESNSGGKEGTWAMNTDGTDKKRLSSINAPWVEDIKEEGLDAPILNGQCKDTTNIFFSGYACAFSEDQKKIAVVNFGGNKGIWISDAEDNNPEQILELPKDDEKDVLYVAWNHVAPKETTQSETSDFEKSIYHPEDLSQVEITYTTFFSWTCDRCRMARIKGTGEVTLCIPDISKGYDNTGCSSSKITSTLSRKQVEDILKAFERNNFIKLKEKYYANITDGGSVLLNLKTGSFEKKVDVYMVDLKAFKNITEVIDAHLDSAFGKKWKEGSYFTILELKDSLGKTQDEKKKEETLLKLYDLTQDKTYLEQFAKAFQNSPMLPQVLFWLGKYREVYKQFPKDILAPTALFNDASALQKEGKVDEAFTLYLSLFKEYPVSQATNDAVSSLAGKLKRNADALTFYRLFLNAFPFQKKISKLKGDILHLYENTIDYDGYIDFANEMQDVSRLLAWIYVRDYKRPEGIKAYEDVIKNTTDKSELCRFSIELGDAYANGVATFSYYGYAGDTDKALEIYLKAFSEYCGKVYHGGLPTRIADIYTGKGEYDEAIDTYEKSLPRMEYPDDIAYTNIAIGDLYMLKRNYEKALEYYNKVHEGKNVKNDVKVWMLPRVATAYLRMHNIEKATGVFKEILANSPQDNPPPDIKYKAENLSNEQKALNADIETLSKGNMQDVTNLILSILYHYQVLEDFENATPFCEKMMKEHSEISSNSKFLEGLSWIYHELGMKDKQKELESLKLKVILDDTTKSEEEKLKQKAWYMQTNGMLDDALSVYKDILKNHDVSENRAIAGEIEELGSRFYNLQKYSLAKEAYLLVVDYFKNDKVIWALTELAGIYERDKDWEKAAKAYQKIVDEYEAKPYDLRQWFAHANYRLGWIYQKITKDNVKAESYYKKLLEIYTDSPLNSRAQNRVSEMKNTNFEEMLRGILAQK